jgi:oligoendopeptidase F
VRPEGPQRAGVDLTTAAPFESTMQVMNEIMDEIEALERAPGR